jgi:predicted small secreted protein
MNMKTEMKTGSRVDWQMVKVLVMVSAACTVAALSACSTVKGAGQDLQDASDGVKDAITD